MTTPFVNALIYSGVRADEIPGYVGVIEQARTYTDGCKEFDTQSTRWMVAGLLLVIDSMRGELVR